jgi:hypothetical protein
MATTFTLIKTVTIGSGGASSIDFTSIPNTFTDICLKYSLRSSAASGSAGYYGTYTFNSLTTNISQRAIYGNGTSALTTLSSTILSYMSGASDYTSLTFSNGELYIPNYTSSNYKMMNQDAVTENNATSVYTFLYSGLWASTAVINAIGLIPAGGSFVQYSTASLYGILKA